MPKHIFEKVADPVTFEFNPFVGTGPYKLHSFDPNGFWTIWEKRADWDKSPTGILYGEPKPKYIVFQYFANEGAKILAQLTHQARRREPLVGWAQGGAGAGRDVPRLSADLPLGREQRPGHHRHHLQHGQVPPYDNHDVRWALLLAIDIVEYMGMAVDGTGTLSPVHIPSLGSYPKDFIEPMQDWLKEFTLDLGNGETFKPYDPEAPQRVVEYAKGRGYVFSEDPAYMEKAFGLGWYKYAPDVAEKLLRQERLLEGRRRQVAAAGRHAVEDRGPDRHRH